LEPYYGGSHRSFLDGLAGRLPGGLDLITLPPRKWKWRMRLSGPWLAAKLAGTAEPDNYRCLLCSTFVDVATLKGLMPEWAKRLPLLTYFHENQFAYPVQVEDERDFHFSLTNLTTALASDRLAFNSQYNLETFLSGCRRLLKKSPDMRFPGVEQEILGKATVLHPGQDFTMIDQAATPARQDKVPVIVWNHRWEYDKNPARFFRALFELDERGVDFKLVVLGQSFSEKPPVFDEARERLESRILKFGYVESREEYGEWLKRGDVVVSTAGHEFFGISVIEAVRAGCQPLLPARLSYPELFPAEFLYREDELVDKLIEFLGRDGLPRATARELTERFSWSRLDADYREWLEG
jgi:glycosyltransferase involved in cell wall biosynthesis